MPQTPAVVGVDQRMIFHRQISLGNDGQPQQQTYASVVGEGQQPPAIITTVGLQQQQQQTAEASAVQSRRASGDGNSAEHPAIQMSTFFNCSIKV